MNEKDKVEIRDFLLLKRYESLLVQRFYSRNLAPDVLRGKYLTETLIKTKTSLSSIFTEYEKIVSEYEKSHPGVDKTTVLKIFGDKILKLNENTWIHRQNDGNFIIQVSIDINRTLLEIDRLIEFIRNTFKIVDMKPNEALNQASVKSTFLTSREFDGYILLDEEVSGGNLTLEQIEVAMKKSNPDIDIFSKEYGKLMLRRLNAMKSEIYQVYKRGINNLIKRGYLDPDIESYLPVR